MQIFGSNNLALDNTLIDNGQGILMINGSDPLAIGNIIKSSRNTAFYISHDISNLFASENHILCNHVEGIRNLSQFGMFLDNELSYNADTGITMHSFSARNLIMNNKVICNVPENIIDSGTGNILINNIDKPCETCESLSDVCGNCADQ